MSMQEELWILKNPDSDIAKVLVSLARFVPGFKTAGLPVGFITPDMLKPDLDISSQYINTYLRRLAKLDLAVTKTSPFSVRITESGRILARDLSERIADGFYETVNRSLAGFEIEVNQRLVDVRANFDFVMLLDKPLLVNAISNYAEWLRTIINARPVSALNTVGNAIHDRIVRKVVLNQKAFKALVETAWANIGRRHEDRENMLVSIEEFARQATAIGMTIKFNKRLTDRLIMRKLSRA